MNEGNLGDIETEGSGIFVLDNNLDDNNKRGSPIDLQYLIDVDRVLADHGEDPQGLSIKAWDDLWAVE